MDQNKIKYLHHALKNIPFDGWTSQMMAQTSQQTGLDGDALFGRDIIGLIEFFGTWADQEMLTKRQAYTDFDTLKINEKINWLVKTRLDILTPHKEAVRAAMKQFISPKRFTKPAQFIWRTADVMWYEAGDTATDYNHYTKRLLLSGVIKSTTLYWLNDGSDDHQKTWGFLDNRIADVLKFGGLMQTVKTGLRNIMPFRQKDTTKQKNNA